MQFFEKSLAPQLVYMVVPLTTGLTGIVRLEIRFPRTVGQMLRTA